MSYRLFRLYWTSSELALIRKARDLLLAVKGHEFGLMLKPEDRAALIVFLKTL